MVMRRPLRAIGSAKKPPAKSPVSIAEKVTKLLAKGDFQLVRMCEHPECTRWFYDRAKSHRRRWRSIAICGNRHKVAAYRKRRQG